MYFRNRAEAGELLAGQLSPFRYENTAVLALSANGVLVGEQIASKLHCGLSLLLMSKIDARGDQALVLGALDHSGTFTLNDMIPAGEMEEYMQDQRGYLEETKIQKLYDMTAIVGEGGITEPELLTGRNVIITSDGVKTGLSFEAALHFLKPISTERIIGAIPVGPIDVIERLRTQCDEFHYLYVPDNFMTIDHYFEDNVKPGPEVITGIINSIVHKWS